jgi:hypothetical protein
MTLLRAVLTPDGRFASARHAAAHYNISYAAVLRRLREGWQGWCYATPPQLPAIALASKPTRKLGPRRPKPM